MTESDPAFSIPARPERTYPRERGLEYEGSVVFVLRPDARVRGSDDTDSGSDVDLESLVRSVLDADAYRWGDFLELPMPLYLVRDEGTGDVFRVSIRDGTVRLHVLPATESVGLRRFYERLVDASRSDWRVECRTDLGD